MTAYNGESRSLLWARWRHILGAFVLFLVMATPAYAGGIPPSKPQPGAEPTPTATAAKIAAEKAKILALDKGFGNIGISINAILAHIKAVSVQMAVRYNQTALTQIKIMMTIMVALLGLRIAFDTLGGLSGAFRAIGELLMIWGVVMWTLTDYSQMTGWITNGFTEAANILLGASAAKPQGMSFFNSKIYLIVVNLFTQIAHLPWMAGSVLSGTFLVSIVDSLQAMIVYIIMALLIFVTGAIYMMFYIISEVYIMVAIAVGPVFLPWALIPWTRKYAVNWVHFLIQGGMYRLIGPVMLGMVADVMNQTRGMGNIITTDGGALGGAAVLNYPAIIFYALFAILEIFLMFQIPTIVQSLSSGFFSASLVSNPVSSVTSKLGKGGG